MDAGQLPVTPKPRKTLYELEREGGRKLDGAGTRKKMDRGRSQGRRIEGARGGENDPRPEGNGLLELGSQGIFSTLHSCLDTGKSVYFGVKNKWIGRNSVEQGEQIGLNPSREGEVPRDLSLEADSQWLKE